MTDAPKPDDVTAISEWIHWPDNAPSVTLEGVADWVNRRPVAAFERLAADNVRMTRERDKARLGWERARDEADQAIAHQQCVASPALAAARTDNDRLTRERDEARSLAGKHRTCVVCGKSWPVEAGFEPAACGSAPACTLEATTPELVERLRSERSREVGRRIETERALAAARAENDRLRAILCDAVALYGRPGGPWNIPSDPGGWLDRARAALEQGETK